MLKAKHIMTENVIYVKEDTPIYEAVDILGKNHIAGIPVVEDDMTLIGILWEKDVLRLLFIHGHESEEGKTVRDFMTRPAVHFDEDDSLIHVCDGLTNSDFRRIPITSGGKLVGVISRADIIECIRHSRHENVGASV
jgi:CBS domain-containing protein